MVVLVFHFTSVLLKATQAKKNVVFLFLKLAFGG